MRQSKQIHDLGLRDPTKAEMGRVRGEESAERFHQALALLYKLGEILYYIRTWANGGFDAAGIDSLVWVGPGHTVPVQVKGSLRGLQEHVAQYGDLIPCIVVDAEDSDEDVLEKAREVLSISTKGLLSALEDEEAASASPDHQ